MVPNMNRAPARRNEPAALKKSLDMRAMQAPLNVPFTRRAIFAGYPAKITQSRTCPQRFA
jgi:hypothetical protein